MKKHKIFLLFSLFVTTSFLFSDYTKLPSNGQSGLTRIDRKEMIPAEGNADLKAELVALENQFKKDHEYIKIDYRSRISSLKEQQKSDVRELKKGYNQRRKAIYKKYGVKPPKNNRNNNKEKEIFRPEKKDKRLSPSGYRK